MTIHAAYEQLTKSLQQLYDKREAANISNWVTEHITGYQRINRIIRKDCLLSDEQKVLLEQYTNALMLHKPVQYVLHEAWFAGLKLYVDENVLIPRPETEELVEWVISSIESYPDTPLQLSIFDIGTGSGCIPIALKKQLPDATVAAIDILAKTLDIAIQNATAQNTTIHFSLLDILDEKQWSQQPSFNCIISNPPYIRESEQAGMSNNVLQHEPHIALFVANDTPLLFYEKIALFASKHLLHGGLLFFEINEALGNEMIAMLSSMHYQNIELRKDLQGRDRMIKATHYPRTASLPKDL